VYQLFTLAFIILEFDNFELPINIIFVVLTCLSLFYGITNKNNDPGRYWCKVSAYIPLVFIPLSAAGL